MRHWIRAGVPSLLMSSPNRPLLDPSRRGLMNGFSWWNRCLIHSVIQLDFKYFRHYFCVTLWHTFVFVRKVINCLCRHNLGLWGPLPVDVKPGVGVGWTTTILNRWGRALLISTTQNKTSMSLETDVGSTRTGSHRPSFSCPFLTLTFVSVEGPVRWRLPGVQGYEPNYDSVRTLKIIKNLFPGSKN